MKIELLKNMKKIIIATIAPLIITACGDVGFQATKKTTGSETTTAVESIYGEVPFTTALGGAVEFKHIGGAIVNVGVESVIGEPLLSKAQQKGNYRVEIGYAHLQSAFGSD